MTEAEACSLPDTYHVSPVMIILVTSDQDLDEHLPRLKIFLSQRGNREVTSKIFQSIALESSGKGHWEPFCKGSRSIGTILPLSAVLVSVE